MNSYLFERDSEPTLIDRFAAAQCDRHRYTRRGDDTDPPPRCVKCGWLLLWDLHEARGGMPYPAWADSQSYTEWLQTWEMA